MYQVDAEMIADFVIVRNRPESEFAAFAHFDTTNLLVQGQRARAVDGGCRQCFLQGHTHRGHGKTKYHLHIFTVGGARVKIGCQRDR